MGNQHSLHGEKPSDSLRNFTPRSARASGASANNLKEATDEVPEEPKDVDHNNIHVGDEFTVWRNAIAKEPSLVKCKVVKVSEQRSEATSMDKHAKLERRPQKTKVISVKFEDGTTEDMLVRSLKVAVERAKKARKEEKEFLAKLAELGISVGTSIDLWVPLQRDGRRSRAAIPSPSRPGDIRFYSVRDIMIFWNFDDIVVDIELVRRVADGLQGKSEILPYNIVRSMLDTGREAQIVLDERLKGIKESDNIEVGSEVDLWLEEAGTNVHGVVKGIGKVAVVM